MRNRISATRRVGGTALAVGAMLLGGLVGTADAAPKERTIVTTPVQWTLTDERCPLVPPGTVIDGEGTLIDEITAVEQTNGTTAITIASVATGTALDQNGATYFWKYRSRLAMENTLAHPNVYSGRFTDGFALHGGPIALNNGFVANYTEDRDAGTFAIDPIASHGDPFDFPFGPNRCDPL